MSSAVVAAVGGLGGLAVFAVVWALLPAPPVHTATATNGPVTGSNGAATAVAGQAPAGNWWDWLVGRWTGYAATRTGLLLGAPAKDLELLGRDVPGYLSSRLTWALGGLAAPALLSVALLVLGVDLPVPFSVALSVAVAVGCSLLPALSVREQAKTAREEFRRAVGAYLDLIAQQRTAGASPSQAMTEAAAEASPRGIRCTSSPTASAPQSWGSWLMSCPRHPKAPRWLPR